MDGRLARAHGQASGSIPPRGATVRRRSRPRRVFEIGGFARATRRGDVIEIVDAEGSRIACGISNYGSGDIEVIKGAHSRDVMALLGYEYGAEVVHRNNLVMA